MKRRTFSLFLLLFMLTMFQRPSFTPIVSASENETFPLTIIHTNDTHAHIENMARKYTAIQSIQSQSKSSILVDAGDVFSGTLYFNQYEGLADVDFMNALHYDAMTIGNHEFDKGPRPFKAFLQNAQFPVVSSNVNVQNDPLLQPIYKEKQGSSDDKGHMVPTLVFERGGEKIGLIGLTTEETSFLSSPGETITFKDTIQTAKTYVQQLKSKGINKIIVLSHLGFTKDEKLAETVPDIDVIVGGHSHTVLQKPVVKNNTVIVQAGANSDYVGKLEVTFNKNGEITSYNGQLISLNEKNDQKEYVIKEDPLMKAKLQEYTEPLEMIKQTVVGYSSTFLDGDKVRTEETNLGNFIADGMLAKAKQKTNASIAIQNGGGIRSSIPKGAITLEKLLTVMPFGNTLVTLELTGHEVIEALENGVSEVEKNAGRFPQVAGIRYMYDPKKPPMERIVSVEVKTQNGYEPIKRSGTYIVATNDYLANGGDNYTVFKNAKNEGRLKELYDVDYDVFSNHLKSFDHIEPKTENRIRVAKEWQPLSYVPSNKIWTITFTHPLNQKTVNDQTIYVFDEDGKKVATPIQYKSSRTIELLPPTNGYQAGKTYRLAITNEVQSRFGKQQKMTTTQPFFINP